MPFSPGSVVSGPFVTGPFNPVFNTGPFDLKPALGLDFIASGGALDGRVTFSRASNATQFDSLGRLVWGPHNLFRSTQNITLGPWTAIGTVAPILIYGEPDPFGGNTATLVDLTPASDCRVAQTTLTVASVPDNCDVTVSFWLRRAPGETLTTHVAQYRKKDNTTVLVNLTVSDVWELKTFTFNSGIGATAILIWLNIQNGPTIKKYIVYGPQLNLGNVAQPYQPNTTALAELFGPRFDYNPQTLAPRGLMIEKQRTNLASLSETASATAATNTPAPSAILGIAARRLTGDGTLTAHFTTQVSTTQSATTVYTVSCYVRYVDCRFVQLITTGSASVATDYANFDLLAGTVSAVGATASAVIQVIGGGVFRISMTYTSIAVPLAGTPIGLVLLTSGTDLRLQANTSVQSVDFMGQQAEAGSFATSLIPTFGTAATRSGDVSDLVSDPPWNQSGTSYYVEWERAGFGAASTAEAECGLFFFGVNGGNAASAVFGFGDPTQVRFDLSNAGTPQAGMNTTVIPALVVGKGAARLAENNGRAAFNGVLTTLDGALSMPASIAGGVRTIGRREGTTQQMNGWLRAIRVYTVPLTDAQLQALTS